VCFFEEFIDSVLISSADVACKVIVFSVSASVGDLLQSENKKA